MTHEHAKIICSKKKNNHPLPGRMAAGVIRRAIRKLMADLTSKDLKFTGPQRYKMYMTLESWRLELKIIELESLEAELTEDQIAEANQPNPPQAQSTIDVDVRSPFFGN
jgi:hypothetical protein